jgi:hypothetical protein
LNVIIAGSRSITDEKHLFRALKECPFEITGVVCGGARGVDKLGKNHAICLGLELHEFPADWDRHGKAAGFIRNSQMADFADALLAIWDGKSRGTNHMVQEMHKRGKPVKVFIIAS